jgi:hypothetical protein
MSSSFRSLLIALSLTLSSAVSHATPPSPDYKLVFEDDFNGTSVNENAWCYRIDRRGGADGDGFIKGLNRRENVSVSGGLLRVKLDRETLDGQLENTGGGLITRQRFGYGYYECRYKPFMGGNRGVHTAFWQRGIMTQSSGSDPTNGAANVIFEIDSSEIDNPHWDGTNNFYLAIGPRKNVVPWPLRMSAPIAPDAEGFVVDAYEYTPQGVIFYDNGKEIARVNFDAVRGQQEVWLTALNGFSYKSMDTSIFPCESAFDYFRYYAKDYPGVNLLPNDGFEYNFDAVNWQTSVAWREEGDAEASVVSPIAVRTGQVALRHHGDRPYKVTTSQTLQNILDGTYTASAWVRSSGGQKTARFVVKSGGAEKAIDIPATSTWTRVEIPVVEVKDHAVTLAFESDAGAFQWIDVDDVVFMKPPAEGQQVAEAKPLVMPADPIVSLFDGHLQSMADGRQYLIDRMVGAESAMTVRFTLKSDALVDQTPLQRVARTGDEGWAVRIGKAGEVRFAIGSLESFEEVVAEKAYEPGKPVQIACVFDRGTATIYIDGKPVAKREGIKHRIDARGAAGSIGAVFTKGVPAQSFTGELGDLRIHNRALSAEEMSR